MHWLLVTLSLAAGMRREAKALGMFNPSTASAWKAALERHIDYAAGLMSPTVMALRSTTEPSESAWAKALPIGFAGALGPNIYWLFDRYGGGGNNALCFMPIMTAAICYMNWKTIGPGLLRLLLLRKLEKAAGRRFINTDYPQIQQLRSGFFLARWLMKDYATAKAMREEADAKAAAPPPPKPRRGSARLRRKEAHQNRHQKDRAAPSDRPDSN